jgi:hypothetical protein
MATLVVTYDNLVKVHKLCRVCQTKILAVSPVMDKSCLRMRKCMEKSHHSNFIIKFDGWTRVKWDTGCVRGCVSCWCWEIKMLMKSRTKLALCNSLKLHQPYKHVEIVLPFYIPPVFTCPPVERHLTQTFWAATYMLQVRPIRSDVVSLRAYNQHVRQWRMEMMELRVIFILRVNSE